jgi:hypothetical protein
MQVERPWKNLSWQFNCQVRWNFLAENVSPCLVHGVVYNWHESTMFCTDIPIWSLLYGQIAILVFNANRPRKIVLNKGRLLWRSFYRTLLETSVTLLFLPHSSWVYLCCHLSQREVKWGWLYLCPPLNAKGNKVGWWMDDERDTHEGMRSRFFLCFQRKHKFRNKISWEPFLRPFSLLNSSHEDL